MKKTLVAIAALAVVGAASAQVTLYGKIDATVKASSAGTSGATSTADLTKGINLAAEFRDNPFSAPFEKVSKAVFAKQDYETRQIKTLFHGPEGAADMAMTAALTEKVRAPLAEAVIQSVGPVDHVLKVKAVP